MHRLARNVLSGEEKKKSLQLQPKTRAGTNTQRHALSCADIHACKSHTYTLISRAQGLRKMVLGNP